MEYKEIVIRQLIKILKDKTLSDNDFMKFKRELIEALQAEQNKRGLNERF